MSLRHTFILALAVLGFAVVMQAQDLPVFDPEVVHPNLRLSVSNLSAVKAVNESNAAIAKAAVAIVLSAANTSCDPASQLNAAVEAHAASSLRILAEKFSGSSCLANGRLSHVDAAFTPNGSIHPDGIIAPLAHGKPLLIRWSGALYVLYGVVYDEHLHNSGKRENVIRKMLLIDPRYSGESRFLAFDREKDDFSKVEGIVELRFVQ